MQRNIKNNKEWVIFGTSPYILTIKDKIEDLCQRYTTIGLNFFCHDFRNTDYWLFADEIYKFLILDLNVYNNQKIVCRKSHFENEKLVLPQYKIIQPHILYDVVNSVDEIATDKFFGWRNSSLPAISLAIASGATKIYLIGIDLPLNGDWQRGAGCNARKSQLYIKKCRQNIYEFKKLPIEIYKINPESDLEFKFKSIDELMAN